MWGKFDELIASDISPDAKAIISAIRMQTEIMNGRLAGVEHTTAALARTVQQSGVKLVGR